MATHRIYALNPSYWRISTGALTTTGLFSSNTDTYVLNPATLTANSLTKSSLLNLTQMQLFRRTLGSGFTLANGSDWSLSSWQSADFGSTLTDVRDNYDLFIESQINNLLKQLNPANYDLSTLLVSGSISGTSYFIPIMIFGSQGSAINVVDTTNPVVGTGITFSNVALTSLTINWGAASDTITPQGSLQYTVLRAANTGLLNTVANAETNGITVLGYSNNVTTANDSGLLPNTSYAYAVIVRDSSGNKALYPAQSQTTLADTTAPTVGTALQFSSVTSSGASLSWGAATDNYNAQSALQYQVVYSLSNNIGTVSNANANGTVAMSWATNTLSYNATGLADSTTYYFAVLVRDAAGNTALYSPVNFQTLDVTNPVVGTGIQTSNLTASSIDLSWGAATDNLTGQASLQYKVVYSTSNNIGTVANANANGTVSMDWTSNTTTNSVTGLTSSTTYYFAVLVRDTAGNTALYSPVSASTSDVTAPTIGTGISFSSLSASGVTVSWGAATDNLTAQESLEYKLVRSLSSNLTSVSLAESNGTTVMDYTANTTTYGVTGLSEATSYYFAVIVRDQAGNKSLYPQQTTTTLDVTAPTIGTGILASNQTGSSIDLSWGAATDAITAQASLQYKVVYSTSNNIGTVSDANSNGTLSMDWTANTLVKSVTGLSEASTYYFAVLVKDSSGNTALYSPISSATLDVTAPTVGTGIQTSNLTTTSIDLSWGAATDAVTAQSSLQYKVVYSTSNNIGTVSNANANGTLSMDWTANTLIKSVTGLSENTSYYFAVLVKDAAENTSLYSPVNASTTSAADTTAPTVGTGIQFANTTDTTMDVSWGAATDNVTTQANLEYKLVSSSTNNLTSVADAESYGSLWMDWTANRLDYPILGATPSTLYYFAVIVRDGAGNKALYTQQSNSTTATPDTTAPTPGNAGAITFSSISENSVTVEWTAATDDVSSQANLEYLVAKNSTSQYLANYGDLISIHPNLIVQSWTSNITSYVDNSVSVGDNPNYIVYVKDEAGNVAGYLLNSVQIPDQTAPSFGSGQMYFNNVTYTSMDLSWDAATDNYDSHPSISYKVLISSSNNISTVADAELNGTMLMDWTANVLYSSASFLSINTTYYFAVLAKDMAGNKTILLGSQATAADTTAPVPGMSGVISVTSFTDTTIDISWSPASEDYSSPSYKIVYSTSDNLNTVANAEANGTLVLDWIPMTTSVSISSLSPDTLYYFQVLVKDEAGNKAIYSGGSQTTDPS